MTDSIQQIVAVQPITPASVTVIADSAFTHALTEVQREIAHLKVNSPEAAQTAASLLTRLTKAGTMLEAARKQAKKPFADKAAEVDRVAAVPAQQIEEAKTALKKMIAAYDALQQHNARVAEEARQAEIRRLQALRDAEIKAQKEREAALALQAAAAAKRSQFRAQAEAATKVLVNGHILSISTDGKRMFWVDLARAPDATEWAEATPEIRQQIEEAMGTATTPEPVNNDLDFGFDEPPAPEPPAKTEVQRQLEAVVHAPAVVEQKPSGVRHIARLRIKSINVAELPELFLVITANEAKLRSTFVVGWKDGDPIPEVSGVVFEVERTVASSGRDVF